MDVAYQFCYECERVSAIQNRNASRLISSKARRFVSKLAKGIKFMTYAINTLDTLINHNQNRLTDSGCFTFPNHSDGVYNLLNAVYLATIIDLKIAYISAQIPYGTVEH